MQEAAKRAREEEERRLAEEERLRKEAEEAEAERLRKVSQLHPLDSLCTLRAHWPMPCRSKVPFGKARMEHSVRKARIGLRADINRLGRCTFCMSGCGTQEAEEAERQRLLEEERQEALRKLQEEEEAKRNKSKKGKGKKK